MRQRVRTAVLPAAGFGTRMLPATRAVPKELLPVGRKPAIEWVIEEASAAGIDWFVIVSSPRKLAIDTYLLGRSDPAGILDAPEGLIGATHSGGRIELVHQLEARGLGDAVRIAHCVLGDEPFALLLPDELLLGGSRLLNVMIDDFQRTGQSGVSLWEVDRSDIGAYGCVAVAPTQLGEERLSITACVEKPDPLEAPSCYALSGRYILGADVLDFLDDVQPDNSGEVQLTSALNRAASTTGLAGFVVRDEDDRVDVGNWEGWFDANARLFSRDNQIDLLASALNSKG